MVFKKTISAFLGFALLLNHTAFAMDTNNDTDISLTDNSQSSSSKGTYKKVGIAGSISLAVLLGLKYLSHKCIFMGSDYPGLSTQDTETYQYLHFGDLSGCSVKLKNPEKTYLSGKCVLVFSPNAGSSAGMVRCHYDIAPLYRLSNRGATLIGVDYRGYGASEKMSALRISESSVYADGEQIYDYVRNTLNYSPENIILFAHSLGGAVSSHVLEYASNKGEKLGGLILASPIDNLYSAASKFTCKPLGAIARVFSMSDLNTEKNLSSVKAEHKDIPIFICSGDNWDVLSLNKTHLHENIQGLRFNNLKFHIQGQCGHCDLDYMFGPSVNGPYIDFIEKQLAPNNSK